MSFAAPDSSCAVFLCKRFFPPPTHIYESVLPMNVPFVGRTDNSFLPLERTRYLRHRNKAVLPDIFSPRRLPPPFPSLPAFSAYPSAPCSALPPFPHDIYLPTTTRLLTQRFHHHSSHIVAHYSHVPFSCQLTAERFFMLLPR